MKNENVRALQKKDMVNDQLKVRIDKSEKERARLVKELEERKQSDATQIAVKLPDTNATSFDLDLFQVKLLWLLHNSTSGTSKPFLHQAIKETIYLQEKDEQKKMTTILSELNTKITKLTSSEIFKV